MEKILAKITIKHEALELDNFYDYNEFQKLGLPIDKDFGIRDIQEGSVFILSNKKWEVEKVYFNLYNKIQRLDEEHQFNLQVIFHVIPFED